MGILGKLIKSAVVGKNLFAEPEPYHKPEVLIKGKDHMIVKADTYMDATDIRAGQTPEGAKYKVATKIGKGLWRLETKDYNDE